MKLNYGLYVALIVMGFGLISYSPGESSKADQNDTTFLTERNLKYNTYDFNTLLSDEERKKIDTALPSSISVKPKKQRILLVVTLNVRNGSVMRGHDSIPYANYAIKMMGDRTGAYETVFCNDILVFKPEKLKQFDAICFNNTVGILFDDPMLRNSLLEYVYSGKGFIGIHAAGATFCQYPVYDQFPEFGEMLGGYEDGGHPWGPNDWITLKLDEPDHPVNAAFDGKGFDISDEVFQFREPNPRNSIRVLVSIDTNKTDVSPERRILPQRRKDMDLAISWVKSYGRGRVFYSSLGHNPHINWNPKVLKHYLDGFQFAFGDLSAAAIPSNKVTPAIRAQEKLGWRLGMTAYSFKDDTLFETIDRTASLGICYLGGLNVQKVSKEIPKNFDCFLSDDELFQIKKKLDTSGVRMVTYYIHNIPADERECGRIFNFAHKMGIETLISEPEPRALDIIEKFCDEYDIQLAIHNHGEKMSPHYWRPEKIEELCRNRSKLIGACGDMGYWMQSGINPKDALKILQNRLITLQVHDLHEFSSEGHDVPWGTGEGRLKAFLLEVKNLGITPALFGLEYSYNWGKSLPEIEKCADYFNAVSIELAQE